MRLTMKATHRYVAANNLSVIGAKEDNSALKKSPGNVESADDCLSANNMQILFSSPWLFILLYELAIQNFYTSSKYRNNMLKI